MCKHDDRFSLFITDLTSSKTCQRQKEFEESRKYGMSNTPFEVYGKRSALWNQSFMCTA